MGEIAQIQLVFNFLFALLIKLEIDKHNPSGWDEFIFDILMVAVNFAGLALALIRPLLEQLVPRSDDQMDEDVDVDKDADEAEAPKFSLRNADVFLHDMFPHVEPTPDAGDLEHGECCWPKEKEKKPHEHSLQNLWHQGK